MPRSGIRKTVVLSLVAVGVLAVPGLAREATAVDGIVERRITEQAASRSWPQISGDKIVWSEPNEIVVHDLATGGQRYIAVDGADRPVVDGELVAWAESRYGNWDIFAYDLRTDTERRVTTNEYNQFWPAVSGDKLVWLDPRNATGTGGWDVYAYDLRTSKERRLTAAPTAAEYPDISGSNVVWTDSRHGWPNLSIYSYNLSTNTEHRVTTQGSAKSSGIDGSTIVWLDYRGPSSTSIYSYNLSNDTEHRVSIDTENAKSSPTVHGNMVVWAEWVGAPCIRMSDLSRGTEYKITNDHAILQAPLFPDVHGTRIVWLDQRNGISDIYMADVSGLYPAISNPYPAGWTSQARVQMHSHYIDDVSSLGKAPGPYSMSEPMLLGQYRQAGYDFAFITEHDPISFSRTTYLNGPCWPSSYTRSSESTQRHHVLAYGVGRPIAESDASRQLDAVFGSSAASGYQQFAVAAHPNQSGAPWTPGEILSAAGSGRPLGVEVYNASVGLAHGAAEWSPVFVDTGSERALDRWNLALYARRGNVFATAGDDYTPPLGLVRGRTSVMVPGASVGMPSTSDLPAWNSRTRQIIGKLRTGGFYTSIGTPIKFTRLDGNGSGLVAETAEPCTIQFWGTKGYRMGQSLKREENVSRSTYAPSPENRYVYITASRGGRGSISQPLWIDGVYRDSAAIPGGSSLLPRLLQPRAAGVDTTLTVPDATLTVPAQSTSTTVTLRTLPAAERPTGPTLGYLSECYEISPKSASLDPQGTLSVTADATGKQLFGAANLAIFRLDETAGTWQPLQTTRNAATDSFDASIGALGVFAVSAKDFVDNTAPSVSLDGITSGQSLADTATITATATDDTGVFEVSFYLEDIKLGADLYGQDGFSATYDFSKIAAGSRTLIARAEDVSGNVGEACVTVQVNSAVSAPTLRITRPTTGSSVSGTMTIEGTISAQTTSVALQLDGESLAQLSPLAGGFFFEGAVWSSGEHTITATAYDEVGNSSSTTVTVNGPAPDTVPPEIVNRTNDTTVTVENTVTVRAAITDTFTVSSALLLYRPVGETGYRATPFEPGGGEFAAMIPSWEVTTTGLEYYIFAQDPDGNAAVAPANAPTGHSHIAVVPRATGSMSINSGARYANRLAVTVNSAVSNAAGMRVRNTGGSWTGWQSVTPALSWTLTTGDGTKTVEAEYRNAAGSVIARSDDIALDTIAPAGSVLINNGAAYTNSRAVSLGTAATDAGSGVTLRRISGDGVFDSEPWEVYALSKVWTLTAGDGAKTVSVQYQDAAGNTSAKFTDTITLDTVPPAGTMRVNNGAVYTRSRYVTLNSSVTGAYQMRFRTATTSTWSAWYAYSAAKSWALTLGDGTKYVYAQYRDSAGNVGALTDTIILDTVAPTGALKINSGAAYTKARTVTLNSALNGGISGMYQMRFRNTTTATWSAWQTYATTKAWTLSTGDGTKYVYAQYKDRAGNIVAKYDTIILDTVAPTGTFKINNGATHCHSRTVTLNSAMNGGTSGMYQMRFRNTTTAAWSSWYTYSGAKTWTIVAGYGTRYVMAQFKDRAGNIASRYDTIVRR